MQASHKHTMQQTHMHKAVSGHIEAIKLLSGQRQSDHSAPMCTITFIWVHFVSYIFGRAMNIPIGAMMANNAIKTRGRVSSFPIFDCFASIRFT